MLVDIQSNLLTRASSSASVADAMRSGDKSIDRSASTRAPKTRPPHRESAGRTSLGAKIKKIKIWIGNFGFASWLGLILIIGGVASVTITFSMLSGLFPLEQTQNVILSLLVANFTLVAGFTGLITWRVFRIWKRRNTAMGAAKLHERLVTLFSLMAIVPAILVAIFAVITLTLSLDNLFGEPVPTAMRNSAKMANFYVQERVDQLDVDLRAMSNDVNNSYPLFQESPIRYQRFLEFQVKARRLTSAYIISKDGRRFASAESESEDDSYAFPPSGPLKTAQNGLKTIYSDSKNSQFRGLVKLPAFEEAYLLIGRTVDRQIFDHLSQTQKVKFQFDTIERNREELEAVFALTYMIIALMVLLGAIWTGLRAADNLASPIDKLVEAAEQISKGNLAARVAVQSTDDEVSHLSRTFNRMTSELQSQQNELIDANTQIDARRRFTETVLAGVSAGVLGLNNNLEITIANRSALQLLSRSLNVLIGQKVTEFLPEFKDLVQQCRDEKLPFVQGHIELMRDGQNRHLNVQVSGDHGEGSAQGFVITFDDITRLVSAQRTAAWADVARRIAHEIRNPLTPIQLSAERIKRKYSKEIVSDPAIFDQCTDTIIRQVSDIGRMVDEFSSFARMPQPVMKKDDLTDLIKKSVFAQKVANAHIEYEMHLPDDTVYADCDTRLLGQAFTNILKNAAEAIETKRTSTSNTDQTQTDQADDIDLKDKITLTLEDQGKDWIVTVTDTGCGLPDENRDKLTEPYMTTRAKGTGLGLAIVKKILEDHNGDLALTDYAPTGGAKVLLTIPKSASGSERPHRSEALEDLDTKHQNSTKEYQKITTMDLSKRSTNL